jgi:hypothetical protein
MKLISFFSLLLLIGCASPHRVSNTELCKNRVQESIGSSGTTFVVKAKDIKCDTGIILKANQSYKIQIVKFSDDWKDGKRWGLSAKEGLDEKGWDTSWLPFYMKWLALFNSSKKCKSAKWFELIATITSNDGIEKSFRIGKGMTESKLLVNSFNSDARLFIFANDHPKRYFNNYGEVSLKITATPIGLNENQFEECKL